MTKLINFKYFTLGFKAGKPFRLFDYCIHQSDDNHLFEGFYIDFLGLGLTLILEDRE